MANPNLPGWLTVILAPSGAVLGAIAGKLADRLRHRKRDQSIVGVHDAAAADKLVGTAMTLLDQMQTELGDLRVQLRQCRDERRLQESTLIDLRNLVQCLTVERDSLRELLDQATRPR